MLIHLLKVTEEYFPVMKLYHGYIANSHNGRALHRYRRGHGFESHSSLNFFRLSFCNWSSCVYNCDDHPLIHSKFVLSYEVVVTL